MGNCSSNLAGDNRHGTTSCRLVNNFFAILKIFTGQIAESELDKTNQGHEDIAQFNDRKPSPRFGAGFKHSTGDTPMDIHHPFVTEFPEHRETIRSLKLADSKFRAMFEEYHQLDDEICRIEEDVEYATDQQIDELKFKRAKLKDALYAAVRKSEAALAH
jgi:uncharacterized protein YdcH (DUF465 family)